ncbi:thioredoxin [Streptomyces sp. NPDC007126]|uniref:Thioredoxin n=1 Tax=Streptomyces salinarius TaxID=2762598 RepID=A0ABW8BBV8_9ACTN
MELTQVTDADFEEVVLKSDKPVVVDFWATWCGPCRQLKPVLEAIAAEHSEIVVVKLDVDQNQETAAAYNVISIPTVNVYKGGELVKTITGTRPKAALEKELAEYFA